jgi:hypothetical protein
VFGIASASIWTRGRADARFSSVGVAFLRNRLRSAAELEGRRLGDPLFWGSLAGALFVAFWAAFPVNRALIARGKGHAVIHGYH